MLGVLEIRVSFTNNYNYNRELRIIDKIIFGIKDKLNIAVNKFLEVVKCNNNSKELKNENMKKKPAYGLLARPKRDKMLRKRLH